MRFATVVLMDDADGSYIWEGSLRQFLRDNDMGRETARDIVKGLRPRKDTGHCEPFTVGGGAHGDFSLLLA